MTATGLASRNFEQFWTPTHTSTYSLVNSSPSAGRRKGPMVGFLDASGRPDLLAGSCEHREVRPRQLIMELAEQFIHNSHEEQTAINVIRSLWSYLNRVDGFTKAAFLIADRDLPPHVWWAECRCGPKRSALQSLEDVSHIPRLLRRPPKKTGLLFGSFAAGFGAG